MNLMLLLNPQLLESCEGFFMLPFIPISGCLVVGEKLHIEFRSTERAARRACRAAQLSKAGGTVCACFPDTCWVIVGSSRDGCCRPASE